MRQLDSWSVSLEQCCLWMSQDKGLTSDSACMAASSSLLASLRTPLSLAAISLSRSYLQARQGGLSTGSVGRAFKRECRRAAEPACGSQLVWLVPAAQPEELFKRSAGVVVMFPLWQLLV